MSRRFASEVVATKLKSADIDAVAQEAASKCSAEALQGLHGLICLAFAQRVPSPSSSSTFGAEGS